MGPILMHMTTRSNQIEIVKLLLDRGANIDSADWFGDAPAHIAGINGHAKLFRRLQDRGADLRKTDDIGQTPTDCLRPVDMPDVIVLHADGENPYEVIVTLPETVHGFRGTVMTCDRVWIPDRFDIETIDWDVVMANDPDVSPRYRRRFDHVRERFFSYNREYAGFVREGRKFLLCSTAGTPPEEPPTDRFTFVMDGGSDYARIIVDLAANKVVYFECNGE